ncbi:hypothetical protein MRX96_010709 [Rhipicephalus microplus]
MVAAMAVTAEDTDTAGGRRTNHIHQFTCVPASGSWGGDHHLYITAIITHLTWRPSNATSLPGSNGGPEALPRRRIARPTSSASTVSPVSS